MGDNTHRCVFCENYQRKRRGTRQNCLLASKNNNYESFQDIVDKASQMNKLDLLNRIYDYQHNSSKIPYHKLCKSDFLNRHKKINQTKITAWHRKREKHMRAREKLNSFIQENIIQNMYIYQLTYVLNTFREFLMEEYSEDELPESFDARNLAKEILAHFRHKIKIFDNNHGRKYVASSTATLTNVNMKWVNDETSYKSSG